MTRNSNGFCNYCKINVWTITVPLAFIVISSYSLKYCKVMDYMRSRRITLHLLLRYRRVMAYVASRRIILLLLCFVGRVMSYMASRRITLLLRLWSLRWTVFFFLPLACRGTLLRVSEVCGNVRKVWWRSLHSGQSPHDGGERFFTLGLTRNGNGLCNYCKVNVCAITIRFAVIVTLRTPHCLRIVLSHEDAMRS